MMKKFKCPLCKDTVETIAGEVWHACPSKKSENQQYHEVLPTQTRSTDPGMEAERRAKRADHRRDLQIAEQE